LVGYQIRRFLPLSDFCFLREIKFSYSQFPLFSFSGQFYYIAELKDRINAALKNHDLSFSGKTLALMQNGLIFKDPCDLELQ